MADLLKTNHDERPLSRAERRAELREAFREKQKKLASSRASPAGGAEREKLSRSSRRESASCKKPQTSRESPERFFEKGREAARATAAAVASSGAEEGLDDWQLLKEGIREVPAEFKRADGDVRTEGLVDMTTLPYLPVGDSLCSPSAQEETLGLQEETLLAKPLAKALKTLGIASLTPLQKRVLLQTSFSSTAPEANFLIQAPTGSGKTLAFLLPTLDRLVREALNVHQKEKAPHGCLPLASAPGGLRAVFLSPSKELTAQTFRVTLAIAAEVERQLQEERLLVTQECRCVPAVRPARILGGVSLHDQLRRLRRSKANCLFVPANVLERLLEMKKAAQSQGQSDTPAAARQRLRGRRGRGLGALNFRSLENVVVDEVDVFAAGLGTRQKARGEETNDAGEGGGFEALGNLLRRLASASAGGRGRVAFVAASATPGDAAEKLLDKLTTSRRASSRRSDSEAFSGSEARGSGVVVGELRHTPPLPRNVLHMALPAPRGNKLDCLRELLRAEPLQKRVLVFCASPVRIYDQQLVHRRERRSPSMLAAGGCTCVRTLPRLAEILGLRFHACVSAQDQAERVYRALQRGLGSRCRLLSGISTPHKRREAVLSLQKEAVLSEAVENEASPRAVEAVLVASELAARGLDLASLTHVINWAFPKDATLFAHRAGRVGRAGNPGCVCTLVKDENALSTLRQVYAQIGLPPPNVCAVAGRRVWKVAHQPPTRNALSN